MRKELKLEIELVPSGQWGTNLRSELPKTQWDALRRNSYRLANYRCEICGGQGDQWPVECHERWHYDEEKKVQKLLGLISLCPDCHKVKHYGRSVSIGQEELVFNHFAMVNELTTEQARDYINEAFNTWSRRSKEDWSLDISWLNQKKPNLKIVI